MIAHLCDVKAKSLVLPQEHNMKHMNMLWSSPADSTHGSSPVLSTMQPMPAVPHSVLNLMSLKLATSTIA